MMDSSSPASHRIDPPATEIGGPARRRGAEAMAPQPAQQANVGFPAGHSDCAMLPTLVEDGVPSGTNEDLLDLHGQDLVRRLQSWSDQLDAREAALNARISQQENRERRFRLAQQDALAELADQQRSVRRMQQEMETRVRRLAFRDES